MNDQEVIRWAYMSGNRSLGEYLEKRLAPQGSHPASCSGESGAAPDNDANKLSSSASPFGGQGTDALDQLEAHLMAQAADWDAAEKRSNAQGRHSVDKLCSYYAAEKREWLAALVELRRASRPQSEHRGGESCQTCYGQGWYADGPTDSPEQIQCADCLGTGSRSERSVPPNAELCDPPKSHQ